MVSELLEGTTLRQALETGPLNVRKTMEYAVQLAEGLARAHSKGIVHRDLKPENIFICAGGGIKILDFGLAKLRQHEAQDPIEEATISAPVITKPGVAMGSSGYMSPEQVRGLPVDHRSDIFIFGAILHEMLSGQRAFRRETYADTTTAILKEDPPDVTTLNPKAPPQLAPVVRHCLEKHPDGRYESIRDVAFELKFLSGESKTPSGGWIATR